jgi:hypothetical protein
MTLYDEVVTVIDQLTLAEKARLVEHLSTALRHALEVEAYKRMPWDEFIERTAGILADDPIERPEQLPLEEREPLE